MICLGAFIACVLVYAFGLPSILYAVVLALAVGDVFLFAGTSAAGIKVHEDRKAARQKGIRGVVDNDK